ncbi:DNA polymerase subunit gamma-2, mitochondrial-like [Antedon mediterranea]|uniref:DNA polymerase subunit gamma-2, mitochondrial-like n=1 Tax=Antedon mediterranea TaxID=105859 RepID=UPI003AF7E059
MSGGKDQLRKVLALCKYHGIFQQANQLTSSIVTGCYDYGPLGSDIKRNIENEWWQSVVTAKEYMFGVECASLHGTRPGSIHQVKVAPLQSDNSEPNTPHENSFVQSSFSNSLCRHYPQTLQLVNKKLPFGIANVGRCYQTVDSTDSSKIIYRMPEFTEMSVNFFTPPKESSQWLYSWQKERLQWWRKFSGTPSLFSVSVQEDAKAADIMFQFPWGVEVIERIANRGSKILEDIYKDTKKNIQGKFKKRFVTPNIIEIVAGLDAGVFAYLVEAVQQKQIKDSNGKTISRKILRLHRRLAPIKVAVVPSKPDREIKELAEYLSKEFCQAGIKVFHIGETPISLDKEFFRFDEMGIPFIVVIDKETLKTGVTEIRNRDTTLKQQVHITGVKDIIQKHLNAY